MSRLILFALSLLILSAMLGFLTPDIATARTTVSQNNKISLPGDTSGFINHTQTGCSSQITVTSAGNSGPGTLRQALINVCTGGTIDFAANLADQTITLTLAQLDIAKTVTITNPNAPNLSVSGSGGDIRVFNIQAGAVVTLSHLSIINGEDRGSGPGGAIYNGGQVVIDHCTISRNGSFGDAGGIFVETGAVLTVTNSIFSDNLSLDFGGAIFNRGTSIINSSTFVDNSSAFGVGGGIYNEGLLTVNNSTFSRNDYLAIRNSGPGTLIIDNSTFSDNEGEAIDNRGTLYLRNSILANGIPSSGADCRNVGTINANLNNLIEDGSCDPSLSGDPGLGPLQNNGGSTPTRALLPGSPAINAGDNGTCLAADQRGIVRPHQGQCDIGAFESRGFTLAISGGNNQSTLVGTPFSLPLKLTITSQSGNEPVDGGLVIFTAPSSGPSTTFAPTTTGVISTGETALNVTANMVVGGPYNLVVSSRGGDPVSFSLTNTTEKITPTITITSSLNPSTFGQVVTFTVVVSSNSEIPTGSVTFVIDGMPQTPLNLVGGQTTFATAALTTGSHTISASYSGDSSFQAGSGSLVGGQVVNMIVLPVVQFSQRVYTATEGVIQNLILTRSGNLNQASQVKVSLVGGTASAGTDYSAVGFPKTITFGSGVTSQIVSIGLIDDTLVESTETISLTLNSLSNAVIGGQPEVIVRIEDNDVISLSSDVYLPLVIK